MQSGKFFSDEILRELGVLKDSSPQALVNEESQVDEAPLGFGAGLAARLGTMMPGQSTRAQARGKLESGKVANNLYQNYYQWLGRNNLQPDEKTIIDFLSANKMPTGNAQAVLKQSQPNPQQTSQTPPQKSATVQKGQFNAPANTPIPQTKSSPFAKKPSQQATTATPSTPYPRTGTPASSLSPPSARDQELDNIKRDQERDAYQNQVAAARQRDDAAKKATDDVRKAVGSTMEESINDILRLSGLSEVITEQLSKKAIDDAFIAAAGEFLDKGYAEIPPVAAAAPGQPPSGTQASSEVPNDETPQASGQPLNLTKSFQQGREDGTAGKPKQSNFNLSDDPKKDFNKWLEFVKQRQDSAAIISYARRELKKLSTTTSATTATSTASTAS